MNAAERMKNMKRIAWAVIVMAALAPSGAQAQAQATKPLEVIVFPGGSNWPIWAAQEKGFFEKNGVAVHLTARQAGVLTALVEGVVKARLFVG